MIFNDTFCFYFFFFFNDTATTEIYTLSLHDALPICPCIPPPGPSPRAPCTGRSRSRRRARGRDGRSAGCTARQNRERRSYPSRLRARSAERTISTVPPSLSGGAGTGAAPLSGGAQLLGPLEHLAFGLDGGRDDELGLLELSDAHGTHRAHAGANGADEVEGAVLGEGGAEEDLLEGARHAHADARPAPPRSPPSPSPGARRAPGPRGSCRRRRGPPR